MSLLKKLIVIISFVVFSSFAYADVVDINRANAQEIAVSLKGVGIKKAEAIVQYREQHGSFKTIEELVNVKGIGTRTVELNMDNIQIKEPGALAVSK